MAGANYDETLWEVLRELWENTPDVSWREFHKLAVEKFGDNVPKFLALSRRAKKENWVKVAKMQARKGYDELDEEIKKHDTTQNTAEDTHSDKDTANDTAKDTDNDISVNNEQKICDTDNMNDTVRDTSNSQYQLRPLPSNFEEAKKYVEENKPKVAMTSAQVIYKTRVIFDRLKENTLNCLDSMDVVRDDINSILENGATEEEMKELKFKMETLKRMIDLNNINSITMYNIGKIEAQYWGLDEEDMKDAEALKAKRSIIKEEAKERLQKAKEIMRNEKRKAFERQLRIDEIAKEIEENGG